jgi:SAM-dependent methyltransferase
MTVSLAPTGIIVEHLDGCPVCGSRSTAPLLQAPDSYLGELTLYACARCGIVYLSPRLAPASTASVEDDSVVYDYTPVAAERLITDVWSERVNWLAGYARIAGRRLLDIGCNRGLLMEAARRQGWQVTGVEVSPVAAQHARDVYGLTVYPALNALAAEEQFDLIMLWHVLEHVTNPVQFLRDTARFLAPRGVMAIQVPDFGALNEYRARNDESGLLCAVHNFFYTERTLRDIIKRAGLHLYHFDRGGSTNLCLTAICTNSRLSALRFRARLRLGM